MRAVMSPMVCKFVVILCKRLLTKQATCIGVLEYLSLYQKGSPQATFFNIKMRLNKMISSLHYCLYISHLSMKSLKASSRV